MTDQELIRALNRLKVETGSLACLGCGHEHNCGIHGCAIIRGVADRLTAVLGEMERVKLERDMAVEDLRVASIEGDMECNWCAGKTDRTRCYNCSFANKWKWHGQKEGLAWRD